MVLFIPQQWYRGWILILALPSVPASWLPWGQKLSWARPFLPWSQLMMAYILWKMATKINLPSFKFQVSVIIPAMGKAINPPSTGLGTFKKQDDFRCGKCHWRWSDSGWVTCMGLNFMAANQSHVQRMATLVWSGGGDFGLLTPKYRKWFWIKSLRLWRVTQATVIIITCRSEVASPSAESPHLLSWVALSTSDF